MGAAIVLVHIAHVASVIVNANHGMMRADAMLCVSDSVVSCWLRLESVRSRLFSLHSRHSCRHAILELYFRLERGKTSPLQ